MLKKIRRTLAVLFFVGISLLLLDFTGTLHLWLGWMAKIQFLPAVMALNLAMIAFLVILTLLFGRVYCSVICPLGVYQDGVSWLRGLFNKKARRRFDPKKEHKWLRYGIWALFVAAIIFGIHAFVVILAPYSAYGRMVQSLLQPVALWINNALASWAERSGSYAFYTREVWLKSLPVLITAVVTLVVITVLAWKGGRTYCNDICPVGTTLSFFSRFSLFRPVIDTDKCKNCHICEKECKASCIDIAAHKIDYSRCVDCFNCLESCKFGALHYRFAPKAGGKKLSEVPADGGESKSASGRRAFIAGTVAALGTTALKAASKKTDGGFAEVLPKQPASREVPLTPPGSRSVEDFYARCTACQLCVAECPNGVLRASADFDRFMQPEMSYERGYCRPECTRCSELCPSGAIRRITREEKTEYHIGLAAVDRSLCVVENGGISCGNCARHCPSGAILMVPVDASDPEGLCRPVVMEDLCTGCGACENLCPVRPLSAIKVNGRKTHKD